VANLPPVSTTTAANLATRFTSVFDTGGKFEKIQTVLMGYSWAGEKLIDEKNQKQKIS
jgi:hypothetical protein